MRFSKILGAGAVAAATIAMAVSASAANKAGVELDYTETEAYINGAPVEAFMAEDHTVVNADDLALYGFYVDYSDAARSLYITTNDLVDPRGVLYNYNSAWAALTTPTSSLPTVTNYSGYAGQLYAKSVASDIKVYLNGTEVVSYAANGGIYVRLTDFTLMNGVVKNYDALRNASWIIVYGNSTPSVAPAALTTQQALDYANAFIASVYTDDVTIIAGDQTWHTVYADAVASTFTFGLQADGMVIGSVTVNYANADIDQDIVVTLAPGFAYINSLYAL